MTDYKLLAQQLKALAEEEPAYIPVLSNASALIMDNVEDLNWAGFYLMNRGSLLLGPFQGHVACIRIAIGIAISYFKKKEKIMTIGKSFVAHG